MGSRCSPDEETQRERERGGQGERKHGSEVFPFRPVGPLKSHTPKQMPEESHELICIPEPISGKENELTMIHSDPSASTSGDEDGVNLSCVAWALWGRV